MNPMHVAQRFERLLDSYRRQDGRRWTGQQLDEATGGVVTRSYFVNLRKGRIDNPGYEKMRAIAKAMGFPPEAWFEESIGTTPGRTDGRDRGITDRIEHLFDAIRNPTTGEPYTNAEVARMTLGDLSEEDVEGIRTGAISDPTVGQIAALAAVFGVVPSYLVDRDRDPSVLDEETLETLADETANARLRESAPLPEREKRIVLGIVREFGEADRACEEPDRK